MTKRHKKNPAAVALGSRNAGKTRVYTPEEQERRRARLAEVRKLRWKKRNTPNK